MWPPLHVYKVELSKHQTEQAVGDSQIERSSWLKFDERQLSLTVYPFIPLSRGLYDMDYLMISSGLLFGDYMDSNMDYKYM